MPLRGQCQRQSQRQRQVSVSAPAEAGALPSTMGRFLCRADQGMQVIMQTPCVSAAGQSPQASTASQTTCPKFLVAPVLGPPGCVVAVPNRPSISPVAIRPKQPATPNSTKALMTSPHCETSPCFATSLVAHARTAVLVLAPVLVLDPGRDHDLTLALSLAREEGLSASRPALAPD